MTWLAEKYPDSFDKHYRPRFNYWQQQQQAGQRWFNPGLPMLCQVCQIPMAFTEPDDPTQICYREAEHDGDRYHFCSDGCRDIFVDEPEKYVQAWLPVHQIFQGNCGGATLPEVLDWYHLSPADRGDFADSQDRANWDRWTGAAGTPAAEQGGSAPCCDHGHD
jgi:phenol hydroxylase P3 protein